MNNEEVKRLVDSLKELNEEIEKMNRNFNTNTLNSVSSCFSDVSSKASSLADSLSLVAENEDYLKSIGEKFFSKVEDFDDVLGGALGTCSSFLNVIPMLELGFKVTSIAVDALNEALRDKSLDKYYESCIKVSDEIGSVTRGVEDAISMFEGFNDKTLISAESVTLRAQSMMQMNEMTLENMQQVIHDAEELRNLEVEKIKQTYSEKQTLLEQQYADENGIISEAGLKEIELLQEQRDQEIQVEQDKCAKTLAIVNEGYLQQIAFDEDYKSKKDAYLSAEQTLQDEHEAKIQSIKDNAHLSATKKNEMIFREEQKHKSSLSKLKNEYYSDLVAGNEKEIAALTTLSLKMVECGAEMDEETKAFVTSMIDNWDSLPEETRTVMEDALKPMLDEMQKRKPELFKEADKIANGIIGKLKSAFDIHSPSRKTREIFRYLMKGCELGLEDEKANLLGITDDISKSVLERMSSVGDYRGGLLNRSTMYSNGASVSESNLSVMNRIAQSKGVIQTVLNIDGREFAVATSGYMKEEMAFMR